MSKYNILVGCDQEYHDRWANNLFATIKKNNPWITLHAHIVNPKKLKKIKDVNYTTKVIDFPNDKVKIGYLQACRFLAVAEKFEDKDMVMTLDVDSVCTKPTSPAEFEKAAKCITVLRHQKDNHWLAGFVTYGMAGFKKEVADLLYAKPLEEWASYHDQNVLTALSKKYTYNEQVNKYWMSVGKNTAQSVFLTLKGDQKHREKYLRTYRSIVEKNS